MAAGSVTIADDGTASGTGAALRLYNLLVASATTAAEAAGVPFPTGADAAKSLRAVANMANDFSSWLVTELTTQTAAAITTGTAGLQRMPASTAENTDTKAPATTKSLALVHTT